MVEFRRFIVGILFLIGIGCLLSACSSNNKIDKTYSINYYIDTIKGHVILTTVCSSEHNNNISVSNVELKIK